MMLTGDSQTTAAAVAQRWHAIGTVRSAAATKAEAVQQLQSEVTFLGMAGDGVNDAPARPWPT